MESDDSDSNESQASQRTVSQTSEKITVTFENDAVSKRRDRNFRREDFKDNQRNRRPSYVPYSQKSRRPYYTPRKFDRRQITGSNRQDQRDHDDLYYPISEDENNGFALIFNIFDFDEKPHWKRYGSDLDCDSLRRMFLRLRIYPHIYKNVSKCEIIAKLASFATDLKHKNSKAVFVCFLTHGTLNGIYAADGKILNLETEIYPLLNNRNSPILRDKPKVFITQACRGSLLDEGVEFAPLNRPKSSKIDSTKRGFEPEVLSSFSDMFILSSSLPLYKSLRSEETGSTFIQTLCKVFREDSRHYDLATMVQKAFRTIDAEISMLKDGNQHIQVKSVPHWQIYGKHKKLFFGSFGRHSRK